MNNSWRHESFIGPLAQGIHPFKDLDHVNLIINRYQDHDDFDEKVIYSMSKSGLKSFRVTYAEDLLSNDFNPELILKTEYILNQTRTAHQIFNSRLIFEIEDGLYLFAETGWFYAHEDQDRNLEELIDNLEAILISAPLSEICEKFCEWLIDNDPIGFEIFRRMSRDGFKSELEIEEELWPYHDSSAYDYRFLNQMTDYADSLTLRVKVLESHPRINLWLSVSISGKNPFKESKFEQREERHLPRNPNLVSVGSLGLGVQNTIKELIIRVYKVMDFEEAESMVRELESFAAGQIFLSEAQLSSKIATCLRLLAEFER